MKRDKKRREVYFGRNIKFLRKRRNYSQVELAEHLEVSVQKIVKWELGVGLPKETTRIRFARVFESELEDLLYKNLELEMSGLSERVIKARKAYEDPYYEFDQTSIFGKIHETSTIILIVAMVLQAGLSFLSLDLAGRLFVYICMLFSIPHMYFVINGILLGNKYTLEQEKVVHKWTKDYRWYVLFANGSLVIWMWYTSVSHMENEIMLRNLALHSIVSLIILVSTALCMIMMYYLMKHAILKFPYEEERKRNQPQLLDLQTIQRQNRKKAKKTPKSQAKKPKKKDVVLEEVLEEDSLEEKTTIEEATMGEAPAEEKPTMEEITVEEEQKNESSVLSKEEDKT